MTCQQLHPFIVDFARGAIDAAAVEAQIARHVRGCHACRALLERERIMSAALRRVAHSENVPPADPVRERFLMSAFDEAASSPSSSRAWSRYWGPALAASLLLAAIALGWRVPGNAPGGRTPIVESHVIEASRTPAAPERSASMPPAPDDVVADDPPDTRVRRIPGRHATGRSWSPALAGPTYTSERADLALEAVSFVTAPGASAGPPLESGTVRRVDLPVAILPALGLWPPASGGATVPVEILVGQDGFARAFRVVE